jgi:hypothetical protein
VDAVLLNGWVQERRAARDAALQARRDWQRRAREEFGEARRHGLAARHAAKLANFHAACTVTEDGTLHCAEGSPYSRCCPRCPEAQSPEVAPQRQPRAAPRRTRVAPLPAPAAPSQPRAAVPQPARVVSSQPRAAAPRPAAAARGESSVLVQRSTPPARRPSAAAPGQPPPAGAQRPMEPATRQPVAAGPPQARPARSPRATAADRPTAAAVGQGRMAAADGHGRTAAAAREPAVVEARQPAVVADESLAVGVADRPAGEIQHPAVEIQQLAVALSARVDLGADAVTEAAVSEPPIVAGCTTASRPRARHEPRPCVRRRTMVERSAIRHGGRLVESGRRGSRASNTGMHGVGPPRWRQTHCSMAGLEAMSSGRGPPRRGRGGQRC